MISEDEAVSCAMMWGMCEWMTTVNNREEPRLDSTDEVEVGMAVFLERKRYAKLRQEGGKVTKTRKLLMKTCEDLEPQMDYMQQWTVSHWEKKNGEASSRSLDPIEQGVAVLKESFGEDE